MTNSDANRPGNTGTLRRRVVAEVRAVCRSYAQIYFSTRWSVGALFIVATFVFPVQGLIGLIGLLLANAVAAGLGMPAEYRTSGFYGYNGLLQGLALGLAYKPNSAFLALFVVVAFVGVLIATNMRAYFDRFIGVPVLSLPFVVTSWIAIAAGRRFDALIPSDTSHKLELLTDVIPGAGRAFTHAVGAGFFQLSLLSGVLVLIGILVFSRHALILAVIGFASGTMFLSLLGGTQTDLNSTWIGFNFILTGIAVGGIFVVPGPDSFLMAAASAVFCALVTAGCAELLWLVGLPILAFPFVVTTTFVLYALRVRTSPKLLSPIVVPAASPEMNLKGAKRARARFVSGIPLFRLPVSGEWTITQGFDGEHTHREQWAHAWDFELVDHKGKAYKDNGTDCSHFFAFKKPVFAPADGKVVKVVDHIEDNAIGQTNQKNNWGNLVIISHVGGVYSALCHLAKGSAAVAEGETIRHGQRIGRVGNSGRSPTPHLHFQAQLSHEIGAPTVSCELLGYITKSKEKSEYHTHGIPTQGQQIEALEVDPSRFNAASFPLGQSWSFKITQRGHTSTEKWETNLDFAGNRFLVCQRTSGKLKLYVDSHVLMLLDYEGPRNTAMEWLFMALPRMPLSRSEVYWTDELPAEMSMPWHKRLLFDLAEPALELAKLRTTSSFCTVDRPGFSVETVLETTGVLADKTKDGLCLVSHFDRQDGLISLVVSRELDELVKIERVTDA